MFRNLMDNLGIQHKAVSVSRAETGFISTLPRNIIAPFEDDKTFLQTYVDAVWVFASVSVVAEAAAQVPFKIFNMRNRENPVEVTFDSMFNALRFPNTTMSQYRLWEATFSFLRLAGDAYWEVQGGLATPEKIYVLRPDLIELVPDAKIGIKKYLYWPRGKNGSDKPVEFDPNEIVHFKTFNPLDQWQGLSPLNPSKLSIAADILSQKYNIKFFENGAAPFGIFSTDQVLNIDKINFIEEKIIKFLQRVENKFSPVILHGGLKYQPVSMGPKDIEFSAGREVNRTDILSSQRATPAVVGLSTANYAEAAQQSKVFRQYRVLPLLRSMQSDIDNMLLQYMAPNLTCLFDTQEIPEYREEMLENELKLRTEYDRGIISLNEYRRALRMPLVDKKLGDKRFILTALSELDENGIHLANPSTPGSNEDPDKIKEFEIDEYLKLKTELEQCINS